MFKWRKDRANPPVQRTEDHDPSAKEQAPPSQQALWNTLAMRPAPPVAQNAHSPAELLTRAASEQGSPLDDTVRLPMEEKLGTDLGEVRVHEGPASAAAAQSIGASAYTIGSDIHLGAGALQSGSEERNRVLTHEAVHTVQQGGKSVPLEGALPVSRPSDSSEREARTLADSRTPTGGASPALAMRDAMRVTPTRPGVQRDIGPNWTEDWALGKMEIKFKKFEGAVAGEDGKITFTPTKKTPASKSIRFIQLARDFDVDAGAENVWTGGEAARNTIRTTADPANNVAGGFFVDQIHAVQKQRTAATDPAVLPYEDVTSPGTIGNTAGKVPATLEDTPQSPSQDKFSFVTSAKAEDTGTYLGTVLWGFETFRDAAGAIKVKNEYHRFRLFQGETTDKALQNFDVFYKNPGTPGAP
jgi:hypothetical protein